MPADLPTTHGVTDGEHARASNLLTEAATTISGPRAAAYGAPSEDYGKVAAMVNALLAPKLAEPLTAADCITIMCCVKLSREANRPARDNMLDLAGYAALKFAVTP